MKYFAAIFLFFAVGFAYDWASLTCDGLGHINVNEAAAISCSEWSQLNDNKIHCLKDETTCWVEDHCWDYLSASEKDLYEQYCPMYPGVTPSPGGGSGSFPPSYVPRSL
jgi:hypothetical protein